LPVDQKRIDAFEQTMTELKAVRERAMRAGLAKRFQRMWTAAVEGCWQDRVPVEEISPLKVYERVAGIKPA